FRRLRDIMECKITSSYERDLHRLEKLRCHEKDLRVSGRSIGFHRPAGEEWRHDWRECRRGNRTYPRNLRKPLVEFGVVGKRIHSPITAWTVDQLHSEHIRRIEAERNG